MSNKISVLMSVYKGENPIYFRESLQSVVNQTLIPDEIVLIKDGPIGNDLENVISDFEKKHKNLFNVISSVENVGLGKALNLGLEHCRNGLIARMDTDDISIYNRFELQVNEFINDPSLSILGSFAEEIDDKGNLLELRVVPSCNSEIKKLIWTCPIIHPSVMCICQLKMGPHHHFKMGPLIFI